MNSNQWQRIEELFHAASLLTAEERAAFLNKECAGDEVLMHEVTSLIAASAGSNGFIEQPAMSLGLRVLSIGQKGSLVGQSIGHYKILRVLGEGGMGEVYLAEDCILERRVALKFLAQWLVDDAWAKDQLMKEARAVARLENPNICGIYGLEQIGNYNFIVMQYVEGETLASLLDKGSLNLDQALDLGEQIIGALSAAHRRGIIHRDIKPQNIVVTAEGQAKVLDFGLAKFVLQGQANLSPESVDQTAHAGPVMGTVAYMSPEQAEGDDLDCRSDIFSFGIVFYEMIAGRNPFLRNTKEATLTATKTAEPPRLSEDLPKDLGGISRKCLEKTRERRYETAGQLLLDLRALRKSRERESVLAWRRYLPHFALGALILAVLLLAGIGYTYQRLTRIHTLAVLPISNQSGQPEKNYLSQGLTRNLSDKFSYLPRLRVKLPTVTAATQNEEFLKVGRELKVEAVLGGEIIKQGDALLLRLIMLNTTDGSASWEQTFSLDSADMFALQDEITVKVTSALGLWLTGDERKLLAKRQTDNQEALKAYMRGRSFWSLKRDRDNLQTAITFFDQAITLDPSFAQAYSGRSDCYVLKSNVLYGPMETKDAMDKARYDARKALEIDPSLPEAHTSLGNVRFKNDWEWQEAEKEFKRALELDPEYAPAHYEYSNLLALLKRSDESIRESEIARDLDPYSPLARMNYGRALYYAGRFDAAALQFSRLLEQKPDYPQALYMLSLVLLQQGNYRDAIEQLKKLHAKDALFADAPLGYAYGKTGQSAEAEGILRELDEFARAKPITAQEKAFVYIGMGKRDEAFALLEQAYNERFANLVYLTTDPLFNDLRTDWRFSDLARRMNLAP